ncbi:MAG: hypothetical protein OXM03_12680 [Chloroflexota bacterium]|nr:hypothetical protein [Chloroflexota bacterium]MDE2841475.1 hypothetical protein [Chloroflexota bacterium]MDE2930564.1 hypothetical protein [Chloroflexota bacterium]
MQRKLTWVFVIAFSGLLGLGLMTITAPRNHVYDPRIDERNTAIVTKRPQEIMDDILARAEGLPKQDIEIVETDGSLPERIRYYPIRRYTVTRVRIRAHEPLWLDAFIAQPSYEYIITADVEYADRDLRQITVHVTRPGMFTGFSIRTSMFRS